MSWVKTVVESTTNAWHTVKVTFLKTLQCFILQRKAEVHLPPLFHKGVISFQAISFGVYTKWFSVTCDAHSFGFVFKVSAKVLDRNLFRTNNSLFCPSPQKLHNTACSESWHLYQQQAWLAVGHVDHENKWRTIAIVNARKSWGVCLTLFKMVMEFRNTLPAHNRSFSRFCWTSVWQKISDESGLPE